MSFRHVAFTVLALVLTADVQAIDVYILTGQSNSLGTTNLESSFDPGSHPADAETDLFWSNVSTASSDPNNVVLIGDSGGAITSLQMQQGQAPSPNFWGPEFGLARRLFTARQADVMVIKVSRGGGGNSFWLPTSGHMYNHLLAEIDAALGTLQNTGRSFDVKGFMYLQGESNNSTEAAAADTRLQALIDGVQSHINANYAGAAAKMYAVVGEIAASQSNSNRIETTHRQRALAATNRQIGFFETNDQPLKSDGIHFGRDAKLVIGRRYADAFRSQAWVEDFKRVAGYSANQGTLTAIPHPVAQGLSESGKVSGVTMEEINDAGTPAWRIRDDSLVSNPEYRQTLAAADFQRMYDEGWIFQATAKVVSGGGLALWSVTADNDPGWGVPGGPREGGLGSMNGFQLSRVNGDELEVALWLNHAPLNLGPGSADDYHTFELRGAAGSSRFDVYIDNKLQTSGVDLTGGPGSTGFENSLLFNSGSTSGTGLEVYWQEVSLRRARARPRKFARRGRARSAVST